MNLLHRAMLSQQQRRQSRHIICPTCELPALFSFYGFHHDDQGARVEQWQCGNCETVTSLSELWPIAPVARVPARHRERSLSIPMLVEESPQFDLAEAA